MLIPGVYGAVPSASNGSCSLLRINDGVQCKYKLEPDQNIGKLVSKANICLSQIGWNLFIIGRYREDIFKPHLSSVKFCFGLLLS